MSASVANRLGFAYPARWWSFTSNVRHLIESYCGHRFGKPEFADRVGMAAHELLENAVKYSQDPDLPIRCELEVNGDRMRVSVQNVGLPDHVAVLREEFVAVTQGAPLEVYVERLQADNPNDESHLGLARIRYEGLATLGMNVDGNQITMEATFDIPR